MPTILNLTPLTDDIITIVKGAESVSFPDRLPASLVPVLLDMQNDDGSLNMSNTNISRIFQIVGRLINRSNPEWNLDRVMDFLDVQDLVPVVQALLSPQIASLASSTPPIDEATSKAATPKRKLSALPPTS